jgi:hypothetical protein
MQVGSLVKFKTADLIGVVIETSSDRVRVQMLNHHNHIWWVDQALMEVLCK